eukprot:scaffold330464_cov58-Tisochrysis_lutea.AAC.2
MVDKSPAERATCRTRRPSVEIRCRQPSGQPLSQTAPLARAPAKHRLAGLPVKQTAREVSVAHPSPSSARTHPGDLPKCDPRAPTTAPTTHPNAPGTASRPLAAASAKCVAQPTYPPPAAPVCCPKPPQPWAVTLSRRLGDSPLQPLRRTAQPSRKSGLETAGPRRCHAHSGCAPSATAHR